MEFFEETLKDKEMEEELIPLKSEAAYLSDLFFMLNESTKQLQRNNMTMVKCNNIIASFITKLKLFKSNVSRGEHLVSELDTKSGAHRTTFEILWSS